MQYHVAFVIGFSVEYFSTAKKCFHKVCVNRIHHIMLFCYLGFVVNVSLHACTIFFPAISFRYANYYV